MWGRSPRCDSDSLVGFPGSSHHRDQLHPQEAGGLHHGCAPSPGYQVEGGRRSADHRRAPPPSPPSSAPTHSEAMDFHGKTPPTYPHWCSLCDVTVMSEKVWLQHINWTPHADGQLQLLQRFPHWDCRLEPDSKATSLETGSGHRADGQSEHSREDSVPQGTANQSSTLPGKTKKHKTVSRSSVVCAKFPPQAVDEVFLRRLAERFGPVIQVMMFPSLAFMELGSAQQAQDLVQFHQKEPYMVQDQQMEFTLSNTFSFPQSSRVVCFSPAPPAADELMTLVRGFGSPLYTLVQSTAVLVEMEKAADAQKLLNHVSSNSLKINGKAINVTFSREFRSLMRVAGALKCQQEEGAEKGSPSREQESLSRTWSGSSAESPSPGSHVVPAAPSAEEAEPEEDSDWSADSNIEGMHVIAANLEDSDLEDDDFENLDEEEQEPEEELPQEVDSPADLKICCTALDRLEEDSATKELHEVTLLSHQHCRGPEAEADTSQREKRPLGPEESKKSSDVEQQYEEKQQQQQRRNSPWTSCRSSEETTTGGGSADTTQRNSEEESDPPLDRPPDSTWIRSRGRGAAEERGAATSKEETLKRRASSQNHQVPEGRKRSCITAKQELDHQHGVTSTPELLMDPQSRQAEPAGGTREHQKPAQPVGTEFVQPVVGYFCHLCQVIYADEAEAKGQHCSSPAHYRKYQEMTGRDPWR